MSKSLSPETVRAVMRELGSRTSKRKAESSRANGKKGGRPRKSQPATHSTPKTSESQ